VGRLQRSSRPLVVAAVAAIGLVLASAPAYANHLTPSNCRTWVQGDAQGLNYNFDLNCWLGTNGSSYINDAVYVQGWQWILFDNAYYPYAIDGVFGTHTASGTMSLQGRLSLSKDGIVGTNTWEATRAGNLHLVRTDTNFRYWRAYTGGEILAQARVANYEWWSLNEAGNAYVHWNDEVPR
jgi:hypothetical protein